MSRSAGVLRRHRILSVASALLLMAAGCLPLDVPRNVRADGGEAAIALSWEPVTRASSYEVYRSLAGANRFLLIGRTTETAYLDAPVPEALPFEYVVRGVDEAGWRLRSSEPVRATAEDEGTAREVCNGLDDDGSGQPDDGLEPIVTGVSLGRCVPEIVECIDGSHQVVEAGIAPSDEACGNTVDDDCDGERDEPSSCGPDLVGPRSIAVDPARDATGVGLTQQIVLRFDEPLDPASVDARAFRLFGPTGEVPGGRAVSEDGLWIRFAPAAPLLSDGVYWIRVDGVTDLAGNPLSDPVHASFRTALGDRDTTAASLRGTSPADGDTDVPTNAIVVFEYDDPLDPLTLPDIHVYPREDVEYPSQSFQVRVPGRVELAPGGTSLRFVSDRPLAVGTLYEATLRPPTGGFRDLAGNRVTHSFFQFRTGFRPDRNPPTVERVSPPDGWSDAPRNSGIHVRFDEPVSAASLGDAIEVTAAGVPLVGSISLGDRNRLLSFTSADPLPPDVEVVVRIAASTVDLAGHPLGRFHVSRFTTGDDVDSIAPLWPIREPDYWGETLDASARPFLRFSEPMDWASFPTPTLQLVGVEPATPVGARLEVSRDLTFAWLTPDAPLIGGRSYRLDFGGPARDLAGNPRSVPSIQFEASDHSDDRAPALVASSPAQDALGLPPNPEIRLVFDEPLSPRSIVDERFRIEAPTGVIPSVVELDVDQIVLRPIGLLDVLSDYRVVGEGPIDAAGNVGAPVELRFTTGASSDDPVDLVLVTTPGVTASSAQTYAPADRLLDSDPSTEWCTASGQDASSGAMPWAEIVLEHPARVSRIDWWLPVSAWSRFTRGVFELYDTEGALLLATGELDLVASPRQLDLADPVPGVVRVRFVGIADGSGTLACLNGIGLIGRPEDPSVPIPDRTGPVVVAMAPEGESGGVAVDSPIVVEFDEPIAAGSLTDRSLRVLVTGYSSELTVGGSFQVDGRVVVFRPARPLPTMTELTVVLDGISDLAGNETRRTAFRFWTGGSSDTSPPRIVAVAPEPRARGVGLGSPITVRFSEPVDLSAAGNAGFAVFVDGERLPHQALRDPTGTIVSLDVSLPVGATVTAVVTDLVFDYAGNAVEPFVWSFETVAGIDGESPSVRSMRPQNGSSGVDPDAPIVLYATAPLDRSTIAEGVFVMADDRLVEGGADLDESGLGLVFVPDAPLPPGALIEVFVTSDVRSAEGVPLAEFKGTFETVREESDVAFAVVATSFGARPDGLPRDAVFELLYSAPIDPGSVRPSRVYLRDPTRLDFETVRIEVSDDGLVLRVTPTRPLRADTSYVLGVYDVRAAHVGRYASFGATVSTFDGLAEQEDALFVTPIDREGDAPVNALVTLQPEARLNPISLRGSRIRLLSDEGAEEPFSRHVDFTGRRVAIVPRMPLETGHWYTVIAQGLETITGVVLPDVESSFFVGSGPDVVAPSLAVVRPAAAATEVPTDTVVEAIYDEPVTGLFGGPEPSIVLGPEALPGRVRPGPGGRSIRLVPDAPLPIGRDLTATYDRVWDLAGNLAEPSTSGFSTSLLPDVSAPRIVSTVPPHGFEGLSRNARLGVRFDGAVAADSLEGRIRVFDARGEVPVELQMRFGNRAVEVVPLRLLAPDEQHALVVGRVADASGNVADAPFEIAFTTGDSIELRAPQVLDVGPGGPSFVGPAARSARSTVAFDMPVDPIAIEDSASMRVYTDGQWRDVSFVVEASRDLRVLRFVPGTPVPAFATMGVTFWGISVGGVSRTAPTVVGFTAGAYVDGMAPLVDSVSPPEGAGAVVPSVRPRIRFDEPIAPVTEGSVAVRLSGPEGRVPAAVRRGAADELVIEPRALLRPGTLYRLDAAGVVDDSGNPMDPVQLAFETALSLADDVDLTHLDDVVVTSDTPSNPDAPPENLVRRTGSAGFWCTARGWDVSSGHSPRVRVALPTATRVHEIRVDRGLGSGSAAVVTAGVVELLGDGDTVLYSTGDVSFTDAISTFVPEEPVPGVFAVRLTITEDGPADYACLDEITLIGAVSDPSWPVADRSPPRALSYVPGYGARDVPVESAIEVVFDEPIDPTSVDDESFQLEWAPPRGGPRIEGRVHVDGRRVTFVPDGPLPAGIAVQYRLPYVRDLSGNGSAHGSSQLVFVTAGAPDGGETHLVASTPQGDPAVTSAANPITLRFSAPVQAGTFLPSAHGLRVHAEGELKNWSRGFSADDTVVTITPPWDLAPGTRIAVYGTSEILDVYGNPVRPFALAFEMGEPLDRDLPRVLSVRPTPAATRVDPDASVVVYTNRAVDPASVPGAFVVSADGVPVDGDARVLGDGRTLVLTPDRPLPAGALVEIFVTGSLRAVDGRAFLPHESHFDVERDRSEYPIPSVVASSPPTSEPVPSNVVFRVRYDYALDPASVGPDTVWVESGAGVRVAASITLDSTGREIVARPDRLLDPGRWVFRVDRPVGADTGELAHSHTNSVDVGLPFDATPPDARSWPPDGATDVPLNARVVVTFDEGIDPLSIDADAIVLADEAGRVVRVAAEVGLDGRTAILTPHAPLAGSARHRLVLPTVSDVAGNDAGPLSITFETGAAPRLAPPSVALRSPADRAEGVPTNPVIALRFDAPVAPHFGGAEALSLTWQQRPISGTTRWEADGRTVTFLPDRPLPVGGWIQVKVRSAADWAGNAIVGEAWSFTVGFEEDRAAPVVRRFGPPRDAIDVPLNASVVIVFDEPLGTRNLDGTGVLRSAGEEIPVRRSLAEAARWLVLTPDVPLAPHTRYEVEIAGAEDPGGNRSTMPLVFGFTTGARVDVVRPEVVFVHPPPGARDVPTNTEIHVRFDEPIHPVWLLAADEAYGIAGAVLPDPDWMGFRLVPDAPLPAFGWFGPRSDFTDWAGNRVASFNAGFRTGAGVDTAPPVLEATTVADGDVDVARSVVVRLRFDERLSADSIEDADIRLVGLEGPIAVDVRIESTALVVEPHAWLEASAPYTLDVTGPTDYAGNPIGPVSLAFTTGQILPPDGNVAVVPGAATASTEAPSPKYSAAGPFLGSPEAWCSADGDSPAAGTEPWLRYGFETAVTIDEIRVTATTRVTAGSLELFDEAGVLLHGSGEIPFGGGEATYVLPQAVSGVRSFRLRITGSTTLTSVCVLAIELIGSIDDPGYGLPDLEGPGVVSVLPAGDGGPAPVDSWIVVELDEPPDPSTVGPETVFVRVDIRDAAPFVGEYRVEGSTITFVPRDPLPAESRIWVYVSYGVQDTSGNPLRFHRSAYFQVGGAPDSVRPTIVGITPVDGAVGVGLFPRIEVRFSEPIHPYWIDRGIRFVENAYPIYAKAPTRLDGNRVVVFEPSLHENSEVVIELTSDVVDLAGNPIDPVSSTFYTVTGPVFALRLHTHRLNGSRIDPDSSLVLYFNEALDPATVEEGIRVAQDGILVDGSYLLTAGPGVVEFVPDAPLLHGAVVEAFVTGDLHDVFGGAAVPDSFYRLVEDSDVVAPGIVAGTLDRSSALPANGMVAVRYTRPIDPASVSLADVRIDGVAASEGTIGVVDDGRAVAYRPAGPWSASGWHRFTLDGVRSVDGSDMPPYDRQFSATLPADVVSPAVVGMQPANGATTHHPGDWLRITFSEPIESASIHGGYIRLVGPTGLEVPIERVEEYRTTEVDLLPHGPLSYGESYRVLIDGLRDRAGNPIVPYAATLGIRDLH